MSIRTRLDALTTKLWESVDAVLDDTTPDPDPDSIAAMNAAIDESIAAIALRVGDDDPTDDLNGHIDTVVAIDWPSRTDEQKAILDIARAMKKMNTEQVSQARRIVSLQRRVRTLQRWHSILARFAMFLDGGPQRVRQTDIDGGE